MSNIFLKTERFILRYLTQEDFEELKEILQDKDVMYAWEYEFSDNDVQNWIDKNLELYKKYNLGYFLMVENISGKILGQAALMPEIIDQHKYYEIGYIQNDTETIKKENNPTLRLTMIQLQYYKSHFILIYSSRIFWGILLSLLLYLLSDSVSYFICSSILLLLLYQVYNNVRNRFTLFLHFLLVIIRYWAIILYFPISLSFMCYLLLLFPVLNLLERSSESRFHIPYISYLIADRNDIPLFRVKYYLTLLFLMLILEFFTEIPLVILFLSFYF